MKPRLVVVLIHLAACGVCRADPVINPANCHAYEPVAGIMTWEQARTAAAARTFRGVSGHLATINSEEESEFIFAAFGPLNSYAIGGAQVGGPEPAGGWTWITGEPWDFTNWNINEPNNALIAGQHEDRLAWFSGNAPRWNDVAGDVSAQVGPAFYTMQGFIVEFEPACCPADIAPVGAPDGEVNVDDLLTVINAWGNCADPTPGNCPADIAPPGPAGGGGPVGNGIVNVDDLLAVINGWGVCP